MNILLAAVPLVCPLPQEPASEPVLVAMTRSGKRVEVVERPDRGALAVQTPFGRLHTPTDPVAQVLSLRPLPEEGVPSGTQGLLLVEELRSDGRLRELVALAERVRQAPTDGHHEELTVSLARALESWGARLDSVPKKVDYQKRTAWLWREVERADGPRALLYAGQLAQELPPGRATADSRQLGYATISGALDSRDPWVRRAATLAAAAESTDEFRVAATLLVTSLNDVDAMVRDGAAQASSTLFPEYADNFWYETLMRAPDEQRLSSARHLALYGGEEALDYLAFALSASRYRAPKRYEFDGRAVQVVQGTRNASMPLLAVGPGGGPCSSATLFAITPDTQRFHNVSTIKIRRPSEAVTASIGSAMQALTGEGEERTADEWLAWYAGRKSELAQP